MDQHGSKTSGISSADRAGLTECLQLLRGPSDERRFVGLLLATKMLPAGDEHVMLSVYEAVGSLFISRLLRPLQIPQTSRSNHEDGQKAAAAAGLGLAVLAGLSTVPRLAVAADFVEKVPLLLKVIREGGINPVVNNDRSEAQSAASDAQSANDHAVSDAMECLVHIARASNEGTAVTLQSRGLSAAAQALHVSSCLCLTGPSCWVYAADLRLVGRPHAIAFCSMACCVGGSSHACLLMTYAQHDCGDIYAFGHQVRMLV